jgi:poly-gamma-glutamate synthesis protein (capsule biosynthesis protein)
LPHSRLWAGAQRNAALEGNATKDVHGYDFRPMFALVKPILSSVDLAICHLETPIAPPDEELSTFPFFGVPSEITDALAYAGYDRCSTASNHAMDRGTRGIDTTLNALDRVGISHTGMARTPSEINPKLIFVNGISIAHMSYTFSYNGLPAANSETWRSALIDTDRILRDVRQARKLGAQVVMLSMHWGNERESAPSSYQTKIADAITKSGEVNLIIGSHAHVLQPIKLVNGTWVIYGLGNFLSDMPTSPKNPPWPASTQDGAIVTTKITVSSDGKVQVAKPVVIPTWVDRNSGWQIRSVVSDLKSKEINAFTRAELQASLMRSTSVLGEYVKN